MSMLQLRKFFPSRSTFIAVCVFAVVVMIAASVPYVVVRNQSGDAWQGVTPQLSHDAIRYFTRTNDVLIRGNFYPHNPYFYEHRNEPSPTPSLNDALVGIPQILGASFNAAYYINIAFWGFAYLMLCFLILRAFGVSGRWSVIGSLWCYAGQYYDMLRPGAMQIVYPLYLAFLLCYLRIVQTKNASILPLAIVTGLSAYFYIYLFMTTLATLGVSVLVFAVRKDWALARRMFGAIILAACVSIPHMTDVLQLSHEVNYAETITRMLFISTHWPQIEAYYYGRWIVLGLALTLLLAHAGVNVRGTATLTIITATGLGIFVAMMSNVVIGKDFDIATHVARFGILWYLLLGTILFRPLYEFVAHVRTKKILQILALLCFVLLAYQMYRNLGRNNALFHLPKEKVVEVQTYRGVLEWLNRQPVGVALAPGDLNSYIPMLTRQYTFFDLHSILFFASDMEMRERYLLLHAFDGMTREEFIARHEEYGGPSPDYLAIVSQTQNRFCLLLDRSGGCPPAKSRISFVDVSMLEAQYESYYPRIRERIKEEYAKYHIRYIVTKAGLKLPAEVQEFCHEAYRDEWFSVCVVSDK